MEISISKATSLHLTDIPGFDPVDVVLLVTGSNSGRMTVSHFSSAWTVAYPKMPSTLAEYISKRDIDDLVRDMNFGKEIFTHDLTSLAKQASEKISELYRANHISMHTADEDMDIIEGIENECSVYDLGKEKIDVLNRYLPDDWYESPPEKLTTEANTLRELLPYIQRALHSILPNRD